MKIGMIVRRMNNMKRVGVWVDNGYWEEFVEIEVEDDVYERMCENGEVEE